MRRHTLALGAAVAAALSACTPTVDAAAEEEAIRAVIGRWQEHFTARSDSGLVALYTPDAVLMPPNEPAVTGVANMRAFFAEFWPMNPALTVSPARVHVMGDGAVVEGTYTMEMTTPAGPQRDSGKYMEHWRKVDDTWMISRDIWNSDNPPSPPPVDTTKQQQT